ncbi:MAG: fibrobacter succinogenes major paralogous domain-containing protein [Ignavibacteriaceae bacterium]|nr:fibrobacter succinogenes major paralogous domain-containing protein [Ignavibacteriaceae bacterium]
MLKSIKVLTILALSIMTFSNRNNIIAQDAIKSVKIGEQIWMVKNLDVTHFNNGEKIPEAKTKEEWEKLGYEGKPAWCNYDNNPKNGNKFGKLYNWYALNDPRKLAPEDWHIPTQDEFETLVTTVNSDGNALKAEGKKLGDGATTNTSGFSALLSGSRFHTINFDNLGKEAVFWSSTENDFRNASVLTLSKLSNGLRLTDGGHKSDGFSIRCIKNNQKYLDKYTKSKYNNTNVDSFSEVSSIRDGIIADLNNIGSMAQMYYHKPTSMGGGGNEFTGWTIPTSLDTTPNGTYTASVTSQSVIIVGTSNEKYEGNPIQHTATVTPTSFSTVKNN